MEILHGQQHGLCCARLCQCRRWSSSTLGQIKMLLSGIRATATQSVWIHRAFCGRLSLGLLWRWFHPPERDATVIRVPDTDGPLPTLSVIRDQMCFSKKRLEQSSARLSHPTRSPINWPALLSTITDSGCPRFGSSTLSLHVNSQSTVNSESAEQPEQKDNPDTPSSDYNQSWRATWEVHGCTSAVKAP